MALIELSVQNLAVIESVRIPVGRGFTVVTGETGAGKSLVIDALALALGGRASAEQVRSGARAARIEAIFEALASLPSDALAQLLDDGEGLLIVQREVTAEGRSLIRLNDRAATVGTLAAIGAALGEIHGQHEQQRLLEAEHQLSLLDRFGGHREVVDEVATLHAAWRAVLARMEELVTDPHELARRVELLEHQVGEISAARLRTGEDVELEARLRAAEHGEATLRSAQASVEALRGGEGSGGAALDALRASVGTLRLAARNDDRFIALVERAAGLAAEIEELARDVSEVADRIELDPAARAGLEERLALIYDLERKYGDGIEAVLEFGDRASRELDLLRNQEELRERAREDELARRTQLEDAAERLSNARADAAARLQSSVNAELPPLGLPGDAFGVAVTRLAAIGPRGADRVEFTFAPNPGEPPRPLGRIASGGEASRLSLALKLVLSLADETPVLVFDEIDAGVGGRNASAIGERLRRLGQLHQVLCVTHLPQVAAYADAHVVVRKRIVDDRTVTEARVLEPDERRAEVAAMLAGERVGDEARAAADALLRTAAAAIP